ncbi:FYVE, RhoGEF and PH domain-containing protein 5 isoform X2 [Hyperolius riggenbachi]
MSRGPKPPIAPKPVLSPATERRCIEDQQNSLNKCSNGEVACPVEIYDADHYRLGCRDSENLDMTYGHFISESQLMDEGNNDLEYEKSLCSEEPSDTWDSTFGEGDITDNTNCSPSQAGEEDSGHPDSMPSRDIESGDSTEVEDSDNTDALSLRSSSTAEADSLVPHSGSMQFKTDLGDMDDFLPIDSNECNVDSEELDADLKDIGGEEAILTDATEDSPAAEAEHEETENCENCLAEDSGNNISLQSCEDALVLSLPPDHQCLDTEECPELQSSCAPWKQTDIEQEASIEPLDHVAAGEEDPAVEEDKGDCSRDFIEELTEVAAESNFEKAIEEEHGVICETNEATEETAEESALQIARDSEETDEIAEEDNMDDSCQIILFESDYNGDGNESTEQLLDTGNCTHILETVTEAENEQIGAAEALPETGCFHEESDITDTPQLSKPNETAADGEGSHKCDDDPAVIAQNEGFGEDGADTAEVSPEDQDAEVKELPPVTTERTPVAEVTAEPEEDDSNPYVLEDSVQSRNRKLLHKEDIAYNKPEEESSKPQCIMEDCNQEGDNHLLCIDRKNIVTRTRSYSGKIPGNVPETVPEETAAEMDAQPPSNESFTNTKCEKPEPKPFDFLRALPRKPSRFIIYPRSCSVEGRENAASMYIESDITFSPYLISSSGSFSQRTFHSYSGMSTPTSVVDIPPPFELASITKKPITKSSPSLLIENESSDKSFKKKKSSFKKFLTLKFKKKTENKVHVDVNVSSSRSSSESSYHGPSRLIDMDRRSTGNSPQMQSRSGMHCHPDSPTAILYYKDKRKGTSKAFTRSVARVESFEDRSRIPFMPLPLTKPRSISFPNPDTSDYENIPAMNSDYENIQIPPRRPGRAGTFTEFFEDPSRALSSANENDGYVDMSSFNNFEVKQQKIEQEAESAYTEPYKVCPIPFGNAEDIISDDDQKSSEDEESSLGTNGSVQKTDGPTRALNIVEDLITSEKEYVEMLRCLHTELHMAMLRALGSEEEDGEEELRLRHGLSQLQYIYSLHEEILAELEQRIQNWEEKQKIADIFLSREARFQHHTAFIVAFDKTTAALDDCCMRSPGVAVVVRDFERNFQKRHSSLRHELVKVVQRVFQYHMILTDYLNNLCPDWAEYEDTQAALLIVSEVADRANESMRHGENLQKLVQIEYSVRGQRSLLQPGREFVKEGTLMKVSGKNRHPRHLFLMNDVLLYTYPQKDGKYRLKNTLSIPGMRVSRPIVENAQNVLKIECMECCLILSASSCSERDDWFSCISRTVQEYYKAPTVSIYNNIELRERLGMSLGERPPSVAHMSHAMMCMNCGSDFTLTLRRHHCHACGKIVCRSCSRNKYPLKYLKDRPSKVCNCCYAELRKRELATASTNSSPQMPRSATSTFTSMFHSIHPSAFRRHKKVPSALMEAATSGESSSISGYLHRCKKGKKYWKKRWFVIKGKVLYTYTACEDKIATESLPLLGFHIVPENWDQNPKLGTVFQLYHKKTLYYSFKASDTNTAIRWVDAIKAASVL